MIGIVLESRAAWGAVAFLIGAFAPTRIWACLAGALADLSAVGAYYTMASALGQKSWSQIWPATHALAVVALLAGAAFGVAGRGAAQDTASRHLWRMAIPLAVMAEGAADLAFPGSDQLTRRVVIVEIAVSAAAIVWLAYALGKDRLGTVSV